MPETRRSLLVTLAGSSMVLLARPFATALYGQIKPIPSPNAPNPNYPPGLEGQQATKGGEAQPYNPLRQKQLREDVEKLYELVADLKTDVEKTDAQGVLSIAVVNKAQQVEKLAKQIKNLTKG